MSGSPLEELASVQRSIAALPQQRAELIATARNAGCTWPDIARALNMTVHGAIKASRPSTTPPGRPRKADSD